MPIRFCEQMQW